MFIHYNNEDCLSGEEKRLNERFMWLLWRGCLTAPKRLSVRGLSYLSVCSLFSQAWVVSSGFCCTPDSAANGGGDPLHCEGDPQFSGEPRMGWAVVLRWLHLLINFWWQRRHSWSVRVWAAVKGFLNSRGLHSCKSGIFCWAHRGISQQPEDLIYDEVNPQLYKLGSRRLWPGCREGKGQVK